MNRSDGRSWNEIRKVKITRGFLMHPEGSVLYESGNTKIICTATIEETVPAFLKDKGQGWVTAEYSMLPRATNFRTQRDISKLKQNARSVEIQRLIARSLRMAVDLKKLGERTIIIDCDVIQADGGTRTASISGGYVALFDACQKLVSEGMLKQSPIKQIISAVSVGKIEERLLLDLDYSEDSGCDVDLNVVMNEDFEIAEIQGTGENTLFSVECLNKLTELAMIGNNEIQNQIKLCLSNR